LLFLHRHPDAELVGVTTVAGNGTLEAVTANARYLCGRFGIAVPIARGAARPLGGELHEPPTFIHGADALGDVPRAAGVAAALDARPAPDFIVDAVRARPGEIVILAVGMLTNLARALIADPTIVTLVRGVVIMGGAFGIDGHTGNARPTAEANIFGDPHAADIVLTAAWPVTIIGLDVTERIVMTTAFLQRLRDGGTPEGAFIWDVTRGYADFHERRDELGGIFAHDPSAAVCALDPAAFTFRSGAVRVVTDGVAVGTTIQRLAARPFPRSGWDWAPAQRVAVDVDTQRVLQTFAAPFLRPRAGEQGTSALTC
jgi:inosine-uridine nucleoside N-ribohydrolase